MKENNKGFGKGKRRIARYGKWRVARIRAGNINIFAEEIRRVVFEVALWGPGHEGIWIM